jgi:hypothetical protein
MERSGHVRMSFAKAESQGWDWVHRACNGSWKVSIFVHPDLWVRDGMACVLERMRTWERS